jgi:hypothetical protein
MGWQREENEAHEGGVVGHVLRDGLASEAGLHRELGCDHGDQRATRIAAGCDCGWRSPRWVTVHERATKDRPGVTCSCLCDAIADNMTLDGLAKAYAFAPPEENK